MFFLTKFPFFLGGGAACRYRPALSVAPCLVIKRFSQAKNTEPYVHLYIMMLSTIQSGKIMFQVDQKAIDIICGFFKNVPCKEWSRK